jgi:ABC-type polysaccharide/polyol phosphate transport system ATPase subunit
MFVRLGFAIAVNVDPEIVLVDEVLAVGDVGFQEKCLSRMNQMKTEGKTFILVTHSFPLAVDFCSRAIVLSQGHIAFDGAVIDAKLPYEASAHHLDS